MVVDHNFNWLKPIRGWLIVATTPLQWLANAPVELFYSTKQSLQSRSSLEAALERLQTRNLLLEQQLQKVTDLTAQNTQLLALLNSSKSLGDNVLATDIIGVDPNPHRQQITINKGSYNGVIQGMPMLDAFGMMGQVTFVAPFSSRVMLITDAHHQIPVLINRSGIRAIAQGSGRNDQLNLLHLPNTSDVQVGDLVLTSGLGGRFPAGYPVGVVSFVDKNPANSFAVIHIRPKAQLDRSRQGLLIIGDKPNPSSKKRINHAKI